MKIKKSNLPALFIGAWLLLAGVLAMKIIGWGFSISSASIGAGTVFTVMYLGRELK